MQQAVFGKKGEASSPESLSRWVDLPGLCCQAAGGYPEWADDLTVAWFLFYVAADLMDKVQDEDPPDPWWQETGPGAALGAATGIYFSASLALNRLWVNPTTQAAANEIIQDFYNSFMVMTSGQYRGLIEPTPSLDQYWENAAAKSGSFFGLACRCAARLATADPERLSDYYLFGRHLGLLIQVRDDLDDIQPPDEEGAPGQKLEIARSLAVIYALAVLPPEDGDRLRNTLAAAPHDTQAAAEVIRLLNQSNAALYLMTEMERQRQTALNAIRRAAQPSPAREKLISYLLSI